MGGCACHGDMCKGGGVCGVGGCYMLCLLVLYCVVDCEALCAF